MTKQQPRHVVGTDGYWHCQFCNQSCRSDNPCDCCDQLNADIEDVVRARRLTTV